MHAKADTHELVVLSLLAEEPRYGYALSKLAAARSEGLVTLTPAALYPLLARLEAEKLVSTSWESVRADPDDTSSKGRRRKWYRLTAKGRKRLDQRAQAARLFARTIEAFLPAEGAA